MTVATGCAAFSVQEYCDHQLITLSRIPCANIRVNTNQNPVDSHRLFRARNQPENMQGLSLLAYSLADFEHGIAGENLQGFGLYLLGYSHMEYARG